MQAAAPRHLSASRAETPRCYYLSPCQTRCHSMLPKGAHAGAGPRSPHRLSETQSHIHPAGYLFSLSSLCPQQQLLSAAISSTENRQGKQPALNTGQRPALPRTPVCPAPAPPEAASSSPQPWQRRVPGGCSPGWLQRCWQSPNAAGGSRAQLLAEPGLSSGAPGVCRGAHRQPSSDPLQTAPLFKILTFISPKKRNQREITGSYTNLQFIIFLKNDMKHK